MEKIKRPDVFEITKKFQRALPIVTETISGDKDLFLCYQSSIAMSFKDEYRRHKKKYKNRQDLHNISNNAAKEFLNMWINYVKRESKETQKRRGAK